MQAERVNHRHREDGKRKFLQPHVALGGSCEQRIEGVQKRRREPDDEKRHAIHAGDGSNLNERQKLLLRRAEQVPRKSGEQSRDNHFHCHPRRRAKQRVPRPRDPFLLSTFCFLLLAKPRPRRREEREIGRERNPAEDGIKLYRDVQQPRERDEVVREARERAEPKGIAAARHEQDERRRDPRQSRDVRLVKRQRQQRARHDGERAAKPR